MPEKGIAKLFRNGRSQAVRLPREFRFEGDRVRVRRLPEGVLLEPVIASIGEWFTELDRLRDGSFLAKKKERSQPLVPRRKIFE
jgi:antitoxin VapB